MADQAGPIIGIVGVCGSGKTTLLNGLATLGFNCLHIAQEHSFVPDMWERICNPDFLIYLEASYETTVTRKNLQWSQFEYQEQISRLRHANSRADIHISTDKLTRQEVLEKAEKDLNLLISLSNNYL
jgi:deoxyadenosine/deoxycytidine kinase